MCARSCNLTSDLFNSGQELGGLQPLSFLGSTSSASYACCATSAWRLLDIGGWLEQAKDNHLQSKSSSKLPSLCSTQRHNGALRQIPPYYSRERNLCAGDPVSHHHRQRTECTYSRTTHSCARSVTRVRRSQCGVPQLALRAYPDDALED